MNKSSHGKTGRRAIGGLLLALAILGQVHAGESHHATHSEEGAIGASVEELLAVVRTMNPELAAMALEAEAAAARVEGSDALPDPKLQVTFEDIAKNSSGLPSRVSTAKFVVQQEFPLWGKRGLKRQVAEADHHKAQGELAALTAELLGKVKTVYAEYHQVHLAMEQNEELIGILRTLVRVAQARYAQGAAWQNEVTAAELERGGLTAERVRLGNERKKLKARLNALLNRAPDAPIVEQPRLRTIPAASTLDFGQLMARLVDANPQLAKGRASLTAAQGNRELASREWFPDVGVGVGVVKRQDEADSFEAMVEMSIPLQWEARRARENETVAMERASQSRLEAERTRLTAELQEALLALESARGVEQITKDSLLPQARMALQSALRNYENGGGESLQVLDAVQRLKKYRVEQIKAQYEQQMRLADIERLIGGEL
ncbi:MAG: TolC family protein [Magnetococcales bacterium]|nr:TolC family protein [Magnetococcales bacterium]